MGHMSDHITWYQLLTGGDTERAVATRAGITTSTLNRQLAKGHLAAENVILVARAYGQNTATALSATGYLTPEEAANSDGDIAQLLTDRQLINELARRIGVTSDELTSDGDNVVDIQSAQPDTHLRYAAKRGKPEPEEGDDDYGDGA